MTRRLSIIMFSAYILSTFFFIYFHHKAIFTADLTWLMHCTHLLLAGKANYYDYFETNPPLILIFNIPAVFLGKLLHLSDGAAFLSWMFLITTVILLQLLFLLKRCFVENVALIAFLFSILCVVFIVLPLNVFGERDVIALLLTFPYLLLMSIRLKGQAVGVIETIVISLMAAIGFSLKPYFLFSLILLEGFYLFKTRSVRRYIRLEPFLIFALMVIYVSVIFVFEPNYFHLIMPLVQKLYIPVFQVQPISVLIFSIASASATIAIFLFIWHVSMKKSDYFLQLILLSTVGFYLAYLLAGQAWWYHIYPTIALSFVGMCYLWFVEISKNYFFSNQADKAGKTYLIYYSSLIFCGTFFFLSIMSYSYLSFSLRVSNNIFDYYQPIATFIADKKNVQSVLIVADSFDYQRIIDLTSTPVQSTTRFPSLLLVPGINSLQLNGKAQEYKKFRNIFFNLYMLDIKKSPPQLIVFENRPSFFYDRHDKKIHYFYDKDFLNSSKRFRDFFSDYHLVKKIQDVEIYSK